MGMNVEVELEGAMEEAGGETEAGRSERVDCWWCTPVAPCSLPFTYIIRSLHEITINAEDIEEGPPLEQLCPRGWERGKEPPCYPANSVSQDWQRCHRAWAKRHHPKKQKQN